MSKANQAKEVVALLPAGGQATRISPLPLSKELYPIGFHPLGQDGSLRPKVACHYLLERMRSAGIQKAFFILRSGKWDIPAYFGDGLMLEMHLGYLIMRLPYGVPYTLDQAYPFVKDAIVALGFPDILFEPEDVFTQLLDRQSQSQADVVLGLFPTEQPEKAGMVDFDDSGRVHKIIEKPATTNLRYMWATAVWSPTFTQFLHEYLLEVEATYAATDAVRPELPIGDVIQAALERGLQVEAEVFAAGRYLDIGTPENLVKAVQSGEWR